MLAKVEKFFSKLMGGTSTERELKKIDPIVEEVNRIAEEYEKLTDDELKAKTNEFRYRLKIGETVDDLLPEAFAAVKDTCRRLIGKSWLVRGQEIVWNMIPYDVQIYGGVVLHQGRIAEMATGEGKTLVATMPLYLNALEGKGAHLITVNDYLAQRDCEWMGEIFKFLGLTVSAIFGGQEPEERKRAYSTDISYGTNNEFGFDYLRDNMATDIWSVVQRPLFYAIVDEVDSVLIDEARTPLIISGSVGAPRNVYNELKPIVENLYKRQQELVKQLINEGKELLEKDEEQAGMMILRALRGDPKNKELLELLTSEFWVKKLIERIQGQFEIDKKMAVVDQELYYTIDEKSHVVDITEKGRIFLSGGRDLDVAYKIQLLDKLDAAVTHLGEIKHAGRFFMQNPVSGKCNGFTPEGRLALVNISEQVSEQTTQALDELASRLHNLAEQPDASSVKKVDRSSLLRGYYLPAKKMEGVINGLSESGRASLLKDGMSAVQEMVSAYEQLLALLVEQADVDSAPAVTRQQQERRKVLQNTFFVTDKQVGCPVGLTEQGRLALLVVHYGGNPLTVPTIFQLDAMLHAEDQDEKLLDYFEFSDDGSILKHISEKGRIALLGGDPDLYVLPDRGIVEERDRQIQLLLDRTLNQTTYDYAARVQAVERLETDIQDISLAIGNSGTPSEASAFYNLNDSDSSFAQFRLTAKGRAFYTDFAEQTQQIVEQLDKDMRQFLVDPEKVFAVREERYIGLHEVELDRLLGASFKETEETIAQWQQTRSAAAETSSVALREELDQYLGSSTQEGVSLSRRFEEIQRIAHIFENLFKFISRNDVSDAEKRRLLRRYFEFSETVKGSVAADASLGLAGLSAAGMERMAGQTIARLQIYDRLMAMQAENPADMEAILEFGENGFPVGLKKAARSLLMDGLPFFSFNEGLKKFREEMLFLSTKKVQTGQELQGLLPKEKAQLRGKHYLFDEREMNELLSALHHPGSVMTTEEIEHWFRQHFVRQPRQIMENRRDRLWRNYSLVEERIQNISQLLRAYTLYHRDIEYVVKTPEENELRRVGGSRGQKAVMIVDQFTGRLMPGRRFSDGLHEALEAKEGVQVQAESQTLATITLQNFFRLYRKLAGMTGTAETEAQEFFSTYKLEVVVVPTNREVIRGDFNDVIFRTRREKFNAVIDEALAMHEQGRPVLIGSISVDVSQHLSNLFAARGIPMANWLQKGDVSRELESGRFHTVLNAKYHKSEAEIVTKAGLPGAITIATNMAGRGTDIKLAEGIANKGGLHIIGSEKHEARRIDRQLRGRAGRQGDPGSSRFYLSLEDDLMRLFGSDRITSIMSSLGSMEEGERIEHPLITKSIERAQKKVEERNFEIRKNLLEYDDVLNDQRKIIYRRRQNLLGFAQPEDLIESKLKKHITDETDRSTWKLADLLQDLQEVFGQTPPFEVDRLEQLKMEEVKEELLEWVTEQIGRRQRYQQMQERHRIFGYTPVETVLDHLVRLKIRLHNGGAADTSKWNIEAIRFELDRLFGSAPDWLEANPEGLGTAADVERRILEWAHRHYQQKCEENAEAFSRILFGALTMPQLLDIFVIGLVNMYLPANAGSVNWRTEEFLHDLERIFESHPQLGHNEMRSIRIEKIIEIVRDWLKGLRLGEDQRERLMHRIFGFFTSLQFADSVIAYLFYEKDDDLGDLSAVDKAFFAQVFGSELLPANNKEQETYRMQARRQTRKAYLDLLAEHQQAYDVVMLGSASNEEIIEAAIHALVQQVLKQYPDAASAQKHFSELLDNVLLSRPDINVPEQRDPQAVASFTEDVVAWGLTFYKTYTDRVGLLQQEELSSEIVSDSVLAMIDDTIYTMIGNTLDKDESLDSNQISRLEGECRLVFRQSPRLYDGSTESMDPNQVMEQLSEWAKNLYHQRIKELGRERVTRLERYFVLEKMDETWRQHLNGIDELREGIGLRGYGQKDPLLEYKREAFTLFGRTIDTINRETVSTLFKVFDVGGEMEDQQMRRIEPQSFTTSHSQVELFKQVMSGKSEAAPPSSPVQQSAARAVRRQPVVKAKNVGRNDPCPCGSGKKYKNCCGRDL